MQLLFSNFFSFLFLSTRTGQASKSDYSRNAVSWVENGEDIQGWRENAGLIECIYFVSQFYPLYQIKPKKNLPNVSVQKKWQGENWKGGRKGREAMERDNRGRGIVIVEKKIKAVMYSS